MRKLFLPVLLLYFINAAAQPLLYSSALIPDSLKKGADAVYILEEVQYDIKSPAEMEMKLHTIVSILNKNGMRHSTIGIPVDKLMKLDEVVVKVYNDLGLEVSHYKKKDFKLEGRIDNSTLASDDKVYYLSVPVPNTPCAIETEYTVNFSSILDIPAWYFGSSTTSVVSSRYVVKTRGDVSINYKTYNLKNDPVIQQDGNSKIYTWEVKNQPIPYKESNSYGPSVYMPWIDVSPLQFSYDGYPGSLTSWKDFGKWSYPFYEEEKPFEPERINFFKTLVQDAKNQREKISILYQYLQKETRYVSIQFGIGGFKPFPISFMEKKKYGDCKALTHYMKNILQSVGIKSYAALINAGANEYPVDPSFSSSPFNHVILCVPLEKDSMWLECTSKQNYPGFLGNFTENRNALLITENGGALVKTPLSKAGNNQWISKTDVTLYEDGGAITTTNLYVSGEFWDSFHYVFTGSTKDNLKNILVNNFGFKVPDDFEVKSMGDSAQGHLVEIKMFFNQYYDFKTGSKHFFPIRHYRLNDEEIKPDEKRVYDYLFDFPYIKTDSTVYHLPGNFTKDAIPSPQNISNDFVTYNNTVVFDEAGQKMNVISHLKLNRHIVEPAKYNDVARSFENIRKDENQKLVLKKQ